MLKPLSGGRDQTAGDDDEEEEVSSRAVIPVSVTEVCFQKPTED